VSKKFCRNLRRSMKYGVRDLARNLTGISAFSSQPSALRRDEFWALKDISFDLRRSEFLGIIGSNGAGKSTLLRVIAGIFPPDRGEMLVRGRVGALIALGAGFHPHFTGRENIYLNGAILGMNRDYINSQMDKIISFAEIGDFLDAPVSTYSSGMRVRLGFSVAAHMAPDILIVDEVLAVGDSSFRERCYNHMTTYKENGGTVIFISHNTLAVEQVCDRVMWMEEGQIVESGDSINVVQSYEQAMLQRSQGASLRMRKAEEQQTSADRIRFASVDCLDSAGVPRAEYEFGESIRVRMRYEATVAIPSPHFVVGVKSSALGSGFLSMMATNWKNIDTRNLPTRGTVVCLMEHPNFAPGLYHVHVGVLGEITGKAGEKWHTPMRESASFIVRADGLRHDLPGIPASQIVASIPPAAQSHRWIIDGVPETDVGVMSRNEESGRHLRRTAPE